MIKISKVLPERTLPQKLLKLVRVHKVASPYFEPRSL
jgi:hypothetical protein